MLNVLGTPDGDQQAANRYPQQHAERAAAADETVTSGTCSPRSAPLRAAAASRGAPTWVVWLQHLEDAGQYPHPPNS
ncbi:hypothetical protein ACWF94_00515 [Streptomyces sp. NPDC055078]